MILDEPTNHLSIEGVEWLEGVLRDSASLTVLLVSHDRAFIDAVCDEVLELDGAGGCFRHAGNYSMFLEGREARLRAAEAAAANAETLLRREAAEKRRARERAAAATDEA